MTGRLLIEKSAWRTLLGTSLFAVVLTFLSTLPSFAQPRQLDRNPLQANNANGKRTALVIGNGVYTNAPPLKNPPNDARDVSATLTKLGFKVSTGINLNQREMKRLIREFGQELKQGGTGLFYYAGHGVQSKGHNYLIPVDAEIQSEAEVEDSGVEVNLVLNFMDDAQNGVNIVILDACRDNPFASSFRSARNGLAQVDAPTGTLIAYATAPGRVASDGAGQNGLYTSELLKHMQVPGLTVTDMFMRVRAEVVKQTSNKQVPWEASSLVGTFYFSNGQTKLDASNDAKSVLNPPTTISQAAREQALWDAVKESGDAQDFRDYLAHYPDGAYAPAARARLRHIESQSRKTNIGPVSSERSQASRQVILVKNENHVISYSEIGEYLVFVLKSARDSSAGIKADVNKNGKVDSRVDLAYGMTPDNAFCPQYLLDEIYSTQCGEFKSRGTFSLKYVTTTHNASVHPVFTFTIPKREMATTGNAAHVVFWFYGSEKTTYPQTKFQNDLSSIIEVRFSKF